MTNRKALAEQAMAIAKSTLGSVLLHPGGPDAVSPKDVIETGKQLRDNQLYKFPILPGAVSVFVQLASSREWAVSGRPRGVTRAIEWINNATTYDLRSGQTYTGYQQFLQRRALDYLTIGRTSFYVKNGANNELEYIDPAYLRFERNEKVGRRINEVQPVKPAERVWRYFNNFKFRADEVFLDHAHPIGTNLFISPIAYILPTAHLAWLVREHTSAMLDGRKIRDIIIVGNPQLADGIELAIHQAAALWNGARPEQVGVPVVEASNGTGRPIADFIHRLGISEIPEKFDEAVFNDVYVNQIAAGLGLSLRQFWNNEKTTNRALEEVQEQRQQQKGPNYFTRVEQRLLNNSGVLEQFGKGVNKVRFGFIEETDLSAKLNDAQVLQQTAQALKDMREVFGNTITPDSYLAWMQNLGTLPYEVEISNSNGGLPVTDQNNVVQNGDNNNQMNGDEEETQKGDESPTAFSKSLKYDEIIMNQDGQVLEKRLKVFSVLKAIASEMYQEQLRKSKPKSDEEAFNDAIIAANKANQEVFCEAYTYNQDSIDAWVKSQVLFDTVVAQKVIAKCVSGENLTTPEQEVIDSLVISLDLEG